MFDPGAELLHGLDRAGGRDQAIEEVAQLAYLGDGGQPAPVQGCLPTLWVVGQALGHLELGVEGDAFVGTEGLGRHQTVVAVRREAFVAAAGELGLGQLDQDLRGGPFGLGGHRDLDIEVGPLGARR